jgi:hypothetical protein
MEHWAQSETDSATDDGVGFELLQAEFLAVRQEISQALTAQQSVLQWSLAAFAAVLGAGLILMSQSPDQITSGVVSDLSLVVFGAALPMASFFSFLVWVGELIRVERAGRYIRGLEKHLATHLRLEHPALTNGPLRWETHNAIGWQRGAGVGRGKQQVGYLGAAGVYFGVHVLSILIFAVQIINHQFPTDETSWKVASLTYAVALPGIFLVTGFWLASGLQKAGMEGEDIASLRPASIKVCGSADSDAQ